MTQEQIKQVFNIIAEIANGDELKPIGFAQIKQKTAISSEKLESIINYLTKEGWIKNRNKVLIDISDIYITHEGIRKTFE